jgi:hypothetical protein
VIEKMVSAGGIEPPTYCSTVYHNNSFVSVTSRPLE